MDGSAAIERNHEAVKRILALLLALAGLAGRVAALPHPVRCLVLGILCRAEAVGREYVIRLAHDLGTFIPPRAYEMTASMTAPKDDSARLARSFRELALMLGTILALARRFAHRFYCGASVRRRNTPRTDLRIWRCKPGVGRYSRALPVPDTS